MNKVDSSTLMQIILGNARIPVSNLVKSQHAKLVQDVLSPFKKDPGNYVSWVFKNFHEAALGNHSVRSVRNEVYLDPGFDWLNKNTRVYVLCVKDRLADPNWKGPWKYQKCILSRVAVTDKGHLFLWNEHYVCGGTTGYKNEAEDLVTSGDCEEISSPERLEQLLEEYPEFFQGILSGLNEMFQESIKSREIRLKQTREASQRIERILSFLNFSKED